MQRADDDGSCQFDTLRDGSHGSQRGKRLVAIIDEPVNDTQAGKRADICSARPIENKLATCARVAGWQPNSNLHARNSFVAE